MDLLLAFVQEPKSRIRNTKQHNGIEHAIAQWLPRGLQRLYCTRKRHLTKSREPHDDDDDHDSVDDENDDAGNNNSNVGNSNSTDDSQWRKGIICATKLPPFTVLCLKVMPLENVHPKICSCVRITLWS